MYENKQNYFFFWHGHTDLFISWSEKQLWFQYFNLA